MLHSVKPHVDIFYTSVFDIYCLLSSESRNTLYMRDFTKLFLSVITVAPQSVKYLKYFNELYVV